MTTTARRWMADASIAALVTGAQLTVSLAHLEWNGRPGSHPGPFGIMFLVIGSAALVLRRWYPDAVLGVVLVTTPGAKALGAQLVWLGLIAGYGVSVWNATAEAALPLAARLITLLSIAELTRAWNARAAAGRRGRGEAAARRASEERLAIARDLHDVVAHSISVINAQANTALHPMDRQPDRVREALTAIREVSGQALAELGSVRTTARSSW